jgi:hypothetical protein
VSQRHAGRRVAAPRRDLRPCVLDDPGDLVAVEAAVEPNADPAAVPDVRRDVETVGIGLRERRLHSRGSGADEREAAVAVVTVPDGREGALVADEERRRAVRRPLVRLREAEADLADRFEDPLLRRDRDRALRPAVSSSAASTRGSSSASRALRT